MNQVRLGVRVGGRGKEKRKKKKGKARGVGGGMVAFYMSSWGKRT